MTHEDSDSFSHGMDEEGMTADQPRPDSDAERFESDDVDEVAEEDKQVNDPDVDTRPAAPVPHTSNVVGRRNPDLPTENLTTPSTNAAPGSAGA